jgi:hypothetical protein
MFKFIIRLENYIDLKINILQITKIYKILKIILKLNFILKKKIFQFKL